MSVLVELNDLKDFLGIPLSDTSQDVRLQMFLDSVEQSVINYCDVSFLPEVVTNEQHDGIDSDIIVPKNFPIISVQQLKFYTDASGAGGTVLTQGSDYYVTEDSITLRDNWSPRGRASCSINYTHGYAEVPADVKMAIMQGVKAENQRFKRNSEDISSRSKMNESESYGTSWDKKTGLPTQIVAKLQPYVGIEVPNISTAQRNR